MNRFRTKKRAKEDAAASHLDSDQPSTGFFRSRKKQVEEPKMAFNIDTALPPKDDFRTSLLMTNLSARFSMLREQDDPNTKIGKASDDSVLYPKRHSRLGDYGFSGGLHDIAEVESIRAPPSFARMESFGSETDLSGNSIMERGRPTDGNNLFGGRQKIYKISTAASSNGVLGGKALYENDVAVSAFQIWKQSERERRSFEDDHDHLGLNGHEADGELGRPESPLPPGYNRRRETSSTTSSASAMARNSTAATSITSQVAPSLKDWYPPSAGPSSTASTPALERNVTRTRRLYEHSLTQDMHDHQSSALSRIDTLSKQRTFGNRTPDLSTNSPSPTGAGFTDRFGADRFGSERRHILTKASAPNLRTTSPSATLSSRTPVDLGPKPSTQLDTKANFPGSPPLSPPISEAEEHPLLAAAIQPGDRGKATAMGVFQKPSLPYDESKYAERQLQLQQGRDTPTQRFRAESIASRGTNRSRSSSSVGRQGHDVKQDSIKTQPSVREETATSTFFDDSDDAPSPVAASTPHLALPSSTPLERPSLDMHPALRQSTLPTPLSLNPMFQEGFRPSLEPHGRPFDSPEDSPTLGPTVGSSLGAGLSGMVRQHLRSESNTSSIYGMSNGVLDQDFNRNSHYQTESFDPTMANALASKSNPWTFEDRDDGESSLESPKAPSGMDDSLAELRAAGRPSEDLAEEDMDEFANQLADARRRVREKLTSYVESDSSRSGSPTPQSEGNPMPSSNSLGISLLKPKSSRGSLIDRSRSTQSKAMKMLGLGSNGSSSNSHPKQSFEEKDSAPPPIPEESMRPESPIEPLAEPAAVAALPGGEQQEDENNIHPGLRAFRQARRELQRRKELETLARHQLPQSAGSDSAPSIPDEERSAGQRTPSAERRPPPPPPVRQRAPSDESRFAHGPPVSMRGYGARDRSGSDANRGTRLRTNSSAHEQPYPGHLNTQGAPPRQPMTRPPGLPGADIRRSPIMPPQGYPGSGGPSPLPSPHPDGSNSAKNLTLGVHPGRGYEPGSGQPSPISPANRPLGLPASPYPMANSGANTPTSMGRPSAPQSPALGPVAAGPLDESMKRSVNKRDISEPTFIMSTSRVPTVTLPAAHGNSDNNGFEESRSRSRTRADSAQAQNAPPLPPINPRRKQEGSRTRAAIDALMGRNGNDETSDLGAPNLPFAGSGGYGSEHGDDARSSAGLSDDEDVANHRRRLRKVYADNGANSRIPNGRVNSPPFVVTGPPASRTVVTSGMKGRIPGGMI